MLNYRSFAKRYVAPLWPWYVVGLCFLALTNFITVKIPNLAGTITDSLEATDRNSLEEMALAIIGLGVAQILCRSLSRILIFWPGRQVEATSKTSLFSHVINLRQDFLDRIGVGDLISRLANDLGQLRVFFAFGMLQVFNLMLLLFFTLSQMWTSNAKLTLICLIPIALMVFLTKFAMPKLQKYNRLNQEYLGVLTNQVTEAFSNAHTVKSNGAETSFVGRCATEIHKVYQTNIKLITIRTFLFPLVGSLSSISQIIVLFFGGNEVIEGRLSIGSILAFNVYLSILAFPLTSLGIIISIYQRGKAALNRLDEVDREKAENTGQGDHPKVVVEGSPSIISLKNLSFTYAGDDKKSSRAFALKDMTLEIKEGQKIGFCGPVGAGKSTLLNVLALLYPPLSNSVFYGGQDLSKVDPHDHRHDIAYALQIPHLFSDTIRANLTFGLPQLPTDEQIESAARMACILDDISKFPDGWNTQVGEKGVRLSGGQKQRLALARLFLRPAKVWLLDDVFAAVDTNTEQTMIQNIFSQDRTILLSSHRPGALRKCDQVYYIEDGVIRDQGLFDQLEIRHPNLGALKPDEP